MFVRLWVRILAPYTGCPFFTLICCKNCIDVCFKRPKINEKEAGVGPFFLKKKLLSIQASGSQLGSVVFESLIIHEGVKLTATLIGE